MPPNNPPNNPGYPGGGQGGYGNIWGVPSPGYIFRDRIRNLDSGLQSGGLPPMDFGSILSMGVSEAIKLQASQANIGAMFRTSIGDLQTFNNTVDKMRDGLNKLGYTRSNFLDFFKTLGQASGQVGQSLQDSTKELLTFSRAFNVDPGSLISLGATVARSTGMTTEVAAGKILGSGVSAAMFDEVAGAESQFAQGRIQLGVGGKAGGATFDAMLGLSESIRGTSDAYIGAGATRVSSGIYGMFASGNPLMMMANPMEAGENWVDYRARLEKPTPDMVRKTMEMTRRMGLGGEMILQQGANLGFSDVVNLRGADLSKINASRRVVTATDDMALQGTSAGERISAEYRDRGATNFGQGMLKVYENFEASSAMLSKSATKFDAILETIATGLINVVPGGFLAYMMSHAAGQAVKNRFGEVPQGDISGPLRTGAARGMASARAMGLRAIDDDLRVKPGVELSDSERKLIRYLVQSGIDVYATGGVRTPEENNRVHGKANSQHLLENGARALDIRTLTGKNFQRAKQLLEPLGYSLSNEDEGTGMHTHIQPLKGTDSEAAFRRLVDALDRNTAAMRNPNNSQAQRARGK